MAGVEVAASVFTVSHDLPIAYYSSLVRQETIVIFSDGSYWENLCIYCHDEEHRKGMPGNYLQ